MIRAQIQFTPAQHAKLKRWATREGVSVAEIVRRCVDDRLAAQGAVRDREHMIREAVAVFGTFKDVDGKNDVARRHDEYLEDIYRR